MKLLYGAEAKTCKELSNSARKSAVILKHFSGPVLFLSENSQHQIYTKFDKHGIALKTFLLAKTSLPSINSSNNSHLECMLANIGKVLWWLQFYSKFFLGRKWSHRALLCLARYQAQKEFYSRVQGVDSDYDEESIRCISTLPQFNPAIQGRQHVHFVSILPKKNIARKT